MAFQDLPIKRKVMAVIMLANTPRFDRSSILPIDNSVVNLPAVAQFETLTESVGTSSAQESSTGVPVWSGQWNW